MRFVMLVRADKNTEAGVLPSEELVAAMGRFNEEMVKAGVLLAGEGIQRVKFSRGAPTVTDGPFPARSSRFARCSRRRTFLPRSCLMEPEARCS